MSDRVHPDVIVPDPLHCPCCGSNDKINVGHGDMEAEVFCWNCGLAIYRTLLPPWEGEPETLAKIAMRDAVTAWNQRSSEPVPPQKRIIRTSLTNVLHETLTPAEWDAIESPDFNA